MKWMGGDCVYRITPIIFFSLYRNLCDTSVSSIARWESGSLHPNMKHQERLAEIFGMRIDDFYINLDTPVTQDYILSQVLKETQKLDLEEQKYVLQVIRGLTKLKHPK